MRLFTFFILFTTLLSCQIVKEDAEELKILLNNCDQVNVTFFDGNDTLPVKVIDTLHLHSFTAVITAGSEENKEGNLPNGRISFINKGDTSLTAFFSTTLPPTSSNCGYIIYSFNSKMHSNKLTPKACMLLNEIYLKMKEKK
jgi:hypothetical protein